MFELVFVVLYFPSSSWVRVDEEAKKNSQFEAHHIFLPQHISIQMAKERSIPDSNRGCRNTSTIDQNPE
jgi:hypothetical protein